MVKAAKAALFVVVFAGVLAQAGLASSSGEWTVSSNPVWSPDGASVAWAEINLARNRYRIETAAASAMAAPHTIYMSKAVDGDCCQSLSWTRSGRILYISNFNLLSVPVTGGRSTVLFRRSASGYILAPDQETVAVVDGCGCGHAPDKIAFVNLGGGAPYELPVFKNVSDDPAAFSPDGTELVFSSATHNPVTDGWSHVRFMAVHVGGGTPVPLATSGIAGARFVTSHMTSPTWSPDGNWVAAWLQTRSAERLITINTLTGRIALAAPPRTEGWPVSWSPDSSRLAYAATLSLGNDAQFAIATTGADGSNRKVFWNRSSELYYAESEAPAWSPDSSKLLFLARTRGDNGPLQLLTVGADGSGLTRIH